MKKGWILWIARVVVLMAITAAPSSAQSPCPWPGPPQSLTDRPSLPDSVTLQVGGESLKLCYSRPSARGRPIFGHLVPFGRPWRTGANEPTMLHLPVRASVAGVDLEPGTYVLMTIPSEESWTLLVNTSTASEPMEMFNALTEIGRAELPVEKLTDHVETLTVRSEQSPMPSLVIEWENTRVRVPIQLTR